MYEKRPGVGSDPGNVVGADGSSLNVEFPGFIGPWVGTRWSWMGPGDPAAPPLPARFGYCLFCPAQKVRNPNCYCQPQARGSEATDCLFYPACGLIFAQPCQGS